MTIKFLPGNQCRSALVSFSNDEYRKMGLSAAGTTLQNPQTRLLLKNIFGLTKDICGLKRDGYYVTVICRPLRKGGCRFLLQFTRQPCGMAYVFGESDDLLDALGQIQKNTDIHPGDLDIRSQDNKYILYIKPGMELSDDVREILSEYSE